MGWFHISEVAFLRCTNSTSNPSSMSFLIPFPGSLNTRGRFIASHGSCFLRVSLIPRTVPTAGVAHPYSSFAMRLFASPIWNEYALIPMVALLNAQKLGPLLIIFDFATCSCIWFTSSLAPDETTYHLYFVNRRVYTFTCVHTGPWLHAVFAS